LAASRLAIFLAGLLVTGLYSTELSNPATADESLMGSTAKEAGDFPELEDPNVGASPKQHSTETPLVPEQLKLKADRQFYDTKRKITIAEGNVTARLGEAQIQADRIEFDTGFRTLFARGSVRLQRGSQFFQASALRYNLVQNEGELDDVYGVIDLEGTPTTPQNAAKKPRVGPSSTEQTSQLSQAKPGSSMACPPFLPPVPDWHQQPWAVTAWGGQMIDAPFGETFLFNGRMRPEAVMGVGLQKRIARAGPIALELEADLFSHVAK
jgi:lipopolysaccharide export system protein LptA